MNEIIGSVPAGNVQVRGITVSKKLFERRPLSRCSGGGSCCRANCCQGGVYLEVGQAKRIQERAASIRPFLRDDRKSVLEWFEPETSWDMDHPQGGTLTSTVVLPDATHPAGRSCVFLTDDFHCAIQAASVSAGENPWSVKPFYCSLFPLVYEKGILTLDEDPERWKLEIGCCVEASETVPLFELFRWEVQFVLGEEGYTELARLAQAETEAKS